jgi:hypothetical protein
MCVAPEPSSSYDPGFTSGTRSEVASPSPYADTSAPYVPADPLRSVELRGLTVECLRDGAHQQHGGSRQT